MKFKLACLLSLAICSSALAQPLAPETDLELYAGVCSLTAMEAVRQNFKAEAEYDELLVAGIVAVLAEEKVKGINLDKAQEFVKAHQEEAFMLYAGCANSVIGAFMAMDEDKRNALADKADELLTKTLEAM